MIIISKKNIVKTGLFCYLLINLFSFYSQSIGIKEEHYRLNKIDSLVFENYYYFEFIRQQEKYHILSLKNNEFNNFCNLKLGHYYSLNLYEIDYIKMEKGEKQYYFSLKQYTIILSKKRKIGGNHSKVYSTSNLQNDKIDCSSIILKK